LAQAVLAHRLTSLFAFKQPPMARDVLVIGATGGCGAWCYKECIAAGLETECLVRDMDSARSSLGPDAKLLQGDLSKPETLSAALTGVKRVVMAVGRRRGDGTASSEMVDFEGVRNLANAAKAAGVSKIVHITSTGVDSPKRPFICVLNYFTRMGLGWKLCGEQALRDSGVPYVVVRPVGLKDKDNDLAPVVAQCKPYEWGIASISRAVVGKICVEALLHAPGKTTINCKENTGAKPGSLKDFDFRAAFGSLKNDGPMPATFEDHVVALQAFKMKVASVSTGLAVGVGALLCYSFRSRP